LSSVLLFVLWFQVVSIPLLLSLGYGVPQIPSFFLGYTVEADQIKPFPLTFFMFYLTIAAVRPP